MKIEEGKSYLDERGVIWTNPTRDSGVKGEPWRLKNKYGLVKLFSDEGTSADCDLLSEIADALDEGAR